MIPRTSAFAWAATFLGLSGPLTEPMYFRARSSNVFALRGRRVIARISDGFMAKFGRIRPGEWLYWSYIQNRIRPPDRKPLNFLGREIGRAHV